MSSNLNSVVIGSALAGLLLGACGGEAEHTPAATDAAHGTAADAHATKPADAALVKTEDAHAADAAHAAAGVGAEGAQTVVNGITLHDCAGKNEFKGISLTLTLADAEADKTFSALSDGGQVRMPLSRRSSS